MEPAAAAGLSPRTRVQAVLTHVGVFAAYVAASVGMTWPLSTRMSDHVLAAKWHHDAYTNTMILATRVLNAMGEGAGGVYENFFFAPIQQTIVFNENLFGLSLLYAPFYLASGNPLLAYNQVLILSLAMAGYGTYLLVAHLSGSRLAAFLAGLAFAFCPYATFEIGRIQLVATAWMPLSVLCLHLALERGQARHSLAFAFCYAMQVGTCLYYAMFMLPILGVIAVWLAWRHRRREVRFWLGTAASGALCAALLAAMIWPYFATRDDFALKRSESFARGYDGELSFLGNVHLDNRVWKVLRHDSLDQGAHEEIAFPTLTLSALALLAIVVPLWTRWRQQLPTQSGQGRADVLRLVTLSVLTFGTAVGVAVFARTAVAALPVVALGVVYFRWGAVGGRIFDNTFLLYLTLFGLSIVLFLGLEPLNVDGRSMHGLYYYLHTYVPGFNGIRKVSRQAIVVMLMLAVLAGYGGAWLAQHGMRRGPVVLAVLTVLVTLEMACVPMRLVAVPAGRTVPSVYRWLEEHPSDAPIAVLPTHNGVRRFRGNVGLAMHNYLTVHHRQRTINGKSSWIPPVTHLFHRATMNFPSPSTKRLLRTLGVERVVLHTSDMARGSGLRMIEALDAAPDQYERIFRDGTDYVYRLKPEPGPAPRMVETPQLPAGVQAVHRWNVKATASTHAQDMHLALDERFSTRWSTQQPQVPGDFIELRLPKPQAIAAVDLVSPEAPFDMPAAYEVSVGSADGAWVSVARRDTLEIDRDQVLHPRSFVFRVVLPKGTQGDRVRVTVLDAFHDTAWTVQEATVWVYP